MKKRIRNKTTEIFVAQCKEIHKNIYDYSRVVYVGSKTPVVIICPKHGEFLQTPNKHLMGQGCDRCFHEINGINKRLTFEEFILRANEVHGNRYDYTKSIYINGHTKTEIICKIHGSFFQEPASHLSKRGCPSCYGLLRGASQKFTREIFLEKAKLKHGEKFDYSKVVYVNSQTKVEIICPAHGSFFQLPNSHLLGMGCQLCANQQMNFDRRFTTEEFIKKSIKTHGIRYDYSKSNYEVNWKKVKITCKKHGEFEQIADSHMAGKGCPKCHSSHGENIIRKYLEEQFIIFREQKTFPGCKNLKLLRFDFYIPRYNLAIEMDGMQHESPENWPKKYNRKWAEKWEELKVRDKIKDDYCSKNNIPLLRIPFGPSILKTLRDKLKELGYTEMARPDE